MGVFDNNMTNVVSTVVWMTNNRGASQPTRFSPLPCDGHAKLVGHRVATDLYLTCLKSHAYALRYSNQATVRIAHQNESGMRYVCRQKVAVYT